MEGAARAAVILQLILSAQLTGCCRSPVVEVLVSPLADQSALRVLELRWEVGDRWRPGDWVALYDAPPEQHIQPRFRAEAGQGRGSAWSGVEEGRRLGEPDFQRRCLGWWAAYWQDGQQRPVAVSCLSTNPRWMEENRHEIGHLKLNNMFLPGTHDSGAFILNYRPFQDSRFNKYIFTQDETILEQLINGARLLDLRIAYDEGNFWVNHGIARLHPLEHVLKDIRNFVDNTNEIVVIDCHEFVEGIKKAEDHYRLIDFIKSIIGHQMAPPYIGWGTSLNKFWSLNKRIILAYNNKGIVKDRVNDVWWPVTHKWGNKRSVHDLYEYFANLFKNPINNGGVFWSAMTELTPNTWDLLTDKLGGLRKMANRTNKIVTSWFEGDWGSKVNGVSVDFLRSSGIVSTAIRWNKRRARGAMCD